MDVVAYLKLDASDFTKGVPEVTAAIKELETATDDGGKSTIAATHALTDAGGVAEATAGAVDQLSSAADNMTNSMTAAAGGTAAAAKGLSAVNATSSLLTGSLQSAAGAGVGLAGALKGLGVAAAGPVAITAAISVALTKAITNAITKARELRANLKFDNAVSSINNMQRAFARLTEVMQGNLDVQRALRGVAAEAAGVELERQLAALELRRREALAAGGEDAQAIDARFDAERRQLEFGGQTAANIERAAEARRQAAENEATIRSYRQEIDRISDRAAEATRSAASFATDASGFGLGRKFNQEQAEKYTQQAGALVKSAEALRNEIEELERKNTVLGEQAKIYEQRNEVVELQRRAAEIPIPEAAAAEQADGGKREVTAFAVAADSLARIGGYVGPGGATPKMETMTQRIVENTKRTNELLARNAIHAPVAAWG